MGLEGLFLFVHGGILLAAAWGIRVGAFVLARRGRPAAPRPRRAWWTAVPLALVVAVVLGWQFDAMPNRLFRLRFRLSEPALTRHATVLLDGPSSASLAPTWVGLFRITRTEVRAGQVRLITTSCGVVDSCGLVYAPGASPQRWQEDRFAPLGGPWWHLFEGF